MAISGFTRFGAHVHDYRLAVAQAKAPRQEREGDEQNAANSIHSRTPYHIKDRKGFKIGTGVEIGASFVLALIGILGYGNVIKMQGMQAAFLAAGLGNTVLGVGNLATANCCNRKQSRERTFEHPDHVGQTGAQDELEDRGSELQAKDRTNGEVEVETRPEVDSDSSQASSIRPEIYETKQPANRDVVNLNRPNAQVGQKPKRGVLDRLFGRNKTPTHVG